MTLNLSVMLRSVGNIVLEPTPVVKPGSNEVLLRMHSVGICGSDVHYWERGRIGDFVLTSPMILGHEGSAIVEELGENVEHLKKGDRVAIEPGVPCRFCQKCKEGRYNLCGQMQFCATPPVHGCLSRFYIHAADFCHKLPASIDTETGALVEPLSVAVHACQRAHVSIGKRVLICGAGPIGLLNLIVARAMGADQVAVTDIDANRLNMAKSMGADHVFLVDINSDKEEMNKRFRAEIWSDGADVSVECSGSELSLCFAILATCSGGTLVVVGMGKAEMKLPIVNALVREIDVRGIFRYVNCYPKAIQLLTSGNIDVRPLITHRFSLEQAVKAFETARNGKAIKVVISCE